MLRKSSVALVGWVPRRLAAWLGAAVVAGSLLPAAMEQSAAAAPRYYLKVRDVEFAPGVAQSAAIVSKEAPKAGTEASTGATPGTGTGTGTGTPAGTEAGTPPAATASGTGGSGETGAATAKGPAQLARELLSETLRKRPEVTLELESPLDNAEAVKAECKRKGLKPYEVNLRVMRMDRSVKPPPPGKKFRMLEQNVKLSLVGVTFPEKMLAVGGDGESTVQIEVGQDVSSRQEQEVLEEALKDAIEQAVKSGLAKLSMPLSKPQKDVRRRPPVKK